MKLPTEFEVMLRDRSIKAAWLSSYDGPNILKCDNCKGAGMMVLSIGVAGPYYNPPTGKDVVAHHDGKHWWRVVSHIAECPVCHNSPVVDPQYVEMPGAPRMMDKLADEMSSNG